MLTLSDRQLQNLVLSSPEQLFLDVKQHLQAHMPELFKDTPMGYLNWLIQDSIDIAQSFKLDDVYMIRCFVTLRWQIAPAFYLQPDITKVLQQTHRSAEQRFDELSTEAYGNAWLHATQFNDQAYWDKNYWSA